MAQNDQVGSEEVNLIVPALPENANKDKFGASLHSGPGAIRSLFSTAKPAPLDKMKSDLEKLAANIGIIAEVIQTKQIGKFKMKSVEVGLAISGEGSIGFATAGVEASITLTLEAESERP